MLHDVDRIKVKLETLFNRINRFEKFANLTVEELAEIRNMAESTRKNCIDKNPPTKVLGEQDILRTALYVANARSDFSYILNKTDNKFAYFIETIDPEMIMLKLYRKEKFPKVDTETNKLVRKYKLEKIKNLSRELIGFSDLRLINIEIYYSKFLKKVKDSNILNNKKKINNDYIILGDFNNLNFNNIDNNKVEIIKELAKKQKNYIQISKTIEELNVANIEDIEEQLVLLILTIDENLNMLSIFKEECKWNNINDRIANETHYRVNNEKEKAIVKSIIKLEELLHKSLFKDIKIDDWTL